MTEINDFAQYPQREEDVTAESLARATTVNAFARQKLIDEYMHLNTPVGTRLFGAEIVALTHKYGVALLLRELAEVDQARADEVAKRLWCDWEDGQTASEWLWEWVHGYGINPEQVSRVAARDARESVKKLKDAA